MKNSKPDAKGSARRPVLPQMPSARRIANRLLPRSVMERVEAVQLRDVGHGYDRFGMSANGVAFGLMLTQVAYAHWFRVRSHGHDHVPTAGPVVLACNHSGTVPMDALMVWSDLVRNGPAGRVPRPVVDHFVKLMPLVNLVFTRGGGFGGSRGNFHALLDAGDMVLVFPEGTPGISKPFSRRYQLEPFRQGHAELAIRHQAPIVPLCVIGAEEQLPQIGQIPLRVMGMPYLPIPGTPFPLPVRFHIWYGAPIDVPGRFKQELANDPATVAALAAEVQARVAELIEHGLAQREGIFT